MRLGTLRTDGGTQAFRHIEGGIELLAAPDVAAIIRDPSLADRPGARLPEPALEQLAPPILWPSTFLCAGLNYFEHAREVGKQPPAYPTLFAKLPGALIGPGDDIELPPADVSAKVDWEAELVVVIDAVVRHADEEQAREAIFGYTAMNDISMRDWQKRTEEWLQGKNFDHSTPVGPVIVTADEFDDDDAGAGRLVETLVGDTIKQSGSTGDLIFPPAALVAYISGFMTLRPGDLIATGTPAGVGSGRTPQEFLHDGDVVTTRIEGIGTLRNRCVVRTPTHRPVRTREGSTA